MNVVRHHRKRMEFVMSKDFRIVMNRRHNDFRNARIRQETCPVVLMIQ